MITKELTSIALARLAVLMVNAEEAMGFEDEAISRNPELSALRANRQNADKQPTSYEADLASGRAKAA